MAAVIAIIVVGGGTTATYAQDSIDKRLLECDGIANMTEKMACFEAVVSGLKQDDDDAPITAPQPVKARVSASSVATASNAAAATAPAVTVVTDVADSTGAGQDAAIDDFGAEDLKAAEEKKAATKKEAKAKSGEVESIHATIVEVWATVDRRFEVRLDNGQVWRETALTRRSNRLPKEGSPVRITKGSLGSYNMKIGSNNRLAGVRRTK